MRPETSNGDHRAAARRVMRIGALIFIAAAVLGCLPLIWGRSSINRYLVTTGLLGVCCGMGCILHGAIDWLRHRAR